jgi:hypothetical protein
MTGNQNSGGYRPDAPQNNPANVSATGGNGQSGQEKMYIPGMRDLGSSGVDTMAQQSGASMYQASSPTASAAPTMSLPEVPQLTDPTAMPDQDVMDGSPIGPGANNIPGVTQPLSDDPDLETIKDYYPILQFMASQPGASQGSKDYVNYLGTII